MIRTLIFGAIAAYVGKKLYDDGKLTEFKEDLSSRVNQVKNDLGQHRARTGTPPSVQPAPGSASQPS